VSIKSIPSSGTRFSVWIASAEAVPRCAARERGFRHGKTQLFSLQKNQDFVRPFIIFFAIPSATLRSEIGMNGSLLQPGRDEEGLRLPGSHRVTG
jgi:hypothetical protein